MSPRRKKASIFILPEMQSEAWERELSRDEEVAIAESLYGFDLRTAKRMAFQRWYRKHVTNETYKRHPLGLWYASKQ